MVDDLSHNLSHNLPCQLAPKYELLGDVFKGEEHVIIGER